MPTTLTVHPTVRNARVRTSVEIETSTIAISKNVVAQLERFVGFQNLLRAQVVRFGRRFERLRFGKQSVRRIPFAIRERDQRSTSFRRSHDVRCDERLSDLEADLLGFVLAVRV